MDIDFNALKRTFDEWATQKDLSKELWPVLWEAFMQGVYAAPSLHDFHE